MYISLAMNSINISTSKLYNTIKRNKLPIFLKKNDVIALNKKQELTVFKERVNLFSDLYIGWQVRESDLSTFFYDENHVYHPSLSEYGKLWYGQKSNFRECLRFTSETSIEFGIRSDTDKIFCGWCKMVYFHSPRESKQFKEYIVIKVISDIQKQPLADVFQNRCS